MPSTDDRDTAAAAAAAAATTTTTATDDDLIASPPGLWLPRTVVKRHREKATLVWISLLAAFFVYVGYIVLASLEARNNPATSIEVKQKHFTMPDVGICVSYLNGCLSIYNCIASWSLYLNAQLGFMEVANEFDAADYPEAVSLMEAYPSCAVLPLSRLTVNETAVDNGDVKSLSAAFSMLWIEDALELYNATETPVNRQLVNLHFIDIDQDLEQIAESQVAVKLPYERVNFTQGEWTPLTENHMVLSLTEFSGITETGARLEVQKTFKQSTSTSPYNWLWPSESIPVEVSFLEVQMTIPKFEYTSIEEVDPVDVWTIIGAIGGGWQLVVLAFGIFVVFSEKQPPDRKMRSFYKAAATATPAATVNKHLSGTRSTPPQEDIELNATSEDLPVDWVKKQRKDGSVYYSNLVTGSTRVSSPNELDDAVRITGPSSSQPRWSATRTIFRGANTSQAAGGSSTSQDAAYGMNNERDRNEKYHPPSGWFERTNVEDRAYYTDIDRKITHWERPAWRTHATDGTFGIQAVDTTMSHTSRGSSSSSARVPTPTTERSSAGSRCRADNPAMDTPCVAPGASVTTAGGGVVVRPLPPVR